MIRIPTSEMLQGLSEDHQDMTKQDDNGIQFGVIAEDGEVNQSIVDEGLPAETLVQSSVRESQTNNNVEDQNHPDHEAQSFKISDSIDSEDQTHWELKNSSEDDNEMEVQHSTMSEEWWMKRLISGIKWWMKRKIQKNGCLIMHYDRLLPNLPLY
ncbi:unnamed protein product [Camellia sinensis]